MLALRKFSMSSVLLWGMVIIAGIYLRLSDERPIGSKKNPILVLRSFWARLPRRLIDRYQL